MSAPSDEPGGGVDLNAAAERMAGLGLRVEDIGLALGISPNTIRATYAEAMHIGQAKANYAVASALYLTATDRTHRSHTVASIYWTKARLGWAETVAVDAVGALGPGVPTANADHITDEGQKARFGEVRAAMRLPPGRP